MERQILLTTDSVSRDKYFVFLQHILLEHELLRSLEIKSTQHFGELVTPKIEKVYKRHVRIDKIPAASFLEMALTVDESKRTTFVRVTNKFSKCTEDLNIFCEFKTIKYPFSKFSCDNKTFSSAKYRALK